MIIVVAGQARSLSREPCLSWRRLSAGICCANVRQIDRPRAKQVSEPKLMSHPAPSLARQPLAGNKRALGWVSQQKDPGT